MRIVLDAMGSDDCPDPEIQAALGAAEQWGDPVLLTGPQGLLEERFQALGLEPTGVEILHAPEVLEMTDKPAEAAREKTESSIAVGLDLIKNSEADAFVTAGNTGGVMATALFRLGRIRGVKRPALAILLPVRNGFATVIDIGANTECKPEFLLQFAIMGSVYTERANDCPSPRVALLSNGEEAGKGNDLVKETYPLFQRSGLNFVGNVEAKEFFGGEVDVLITDGFTGNVFVKTSEAVADFLLRTVRDEIMGSTRTKLGGQLAKPAFSRVRKLLDPAEYGAAPLLGVNGNIFIGHGRSNARALVNAIRSARSAVAGGVLEATREAIRDQLSL
jgi:glycerol-3-phosphate acyltransferase PlsX